MLPYHCISQSFDLPPATTSVSHLTCPLPPHQSVSARARARGNTSARARASTSARDRASASARHRALLYHCISQSFDLPPATTSVSHLTCPLPPHQSVSASASARARASASARDRASASARHRALWYHCISQSFDLPPATTSVSHLTCPLPPHQSVSASARARGNTSTRARASTSARDRASASARHRALLYHCISQSFDLPPATTSVSHLTCPLPPHQSVSASASARARASASARDRASASARHRALWYHCISQSFDLPPATTSVSHLTCPLPPHQSVSASASARARASASARDRASASTRHRALWYHCISQSFDLPPATTSVSHLTCPLPPHQSVSASARARGNTSARARASTSARDRASASARHRALLYHCISQSFDLPPPTTSVSHLTCPLPPHQSVSASASARARASASARDRASASTRHRALWYHCISQSFDLPPATTSVSHLTCPLPPHHQSVLALELELALGLEIELALALDIERYCITASVSHLTCPLPPHQSVI